jgi:predicted RNase H-like HicB family nuclease
MEHLTYSVHIEPMEEGGYSVEVPALPGCVTWGHTYEEAVAMGKDAIEGFLASLQKHGEPIPVEKQPHQPRILGIQVNMPATA